MKFESGAETLCSPDPQGRPERPCCVTEHCMLCGASAGMVQ
ncbi:hypothetical protein [Akkermansia massiliensis]|nr:hypothetical protein [Akkermansia sp. B2-R-115]